MTWVTYARHTLAVILGAITAALTGGDPVEGANAITGSITEGITLLGATLGAFVYAWSEKAMKLITPDSDQG